MLFWPPTAVTNFSGVIWDTIWTHSLPDGGITGNTAVEKGLSFLWPSLLIAPERISKNWGSRTITVSKERVEFHTS